MQHNSNARIMVAVSVGESEPLKMQDPFKRDVKLSRLKIYVPWVCEAKASPPVLSAQHICGVKTSESTCTQNKMQLMHMAHTQRK